MSDDELDPQHEAVRRLLADARHDGPTPDHVVARLDKVLADLGAEPARLRPVTDLATRRRRVTGLLVAAAAVVVLGVGVSQVVQPTSEDDSASSGPAATADRAAGADTEEAPEEAQEDGDNLSSLPQALNGEVAGGEGGAFRLNAKDFSTDALVVQDLTLNKRGAQSTYGYLDSRKDAAAAACRVDAWGKGTFVAVTYRRAPAVLVFRRALGDTQVADLFLCGNTEPTRSVTLPAP